MDAAPTAEGPVEREIKLRFDSVAAAQAAVATLGATPLRARRLQDDLLLDDEPGTLRERGCALRVRRDGDAAVLTWKGPPQPSSDLKIREELETPVASADVVLRVCRELGYVARFRYQKYRTEFALPQLVVAIDETPIGCFVELEGAEPAIEAAVSRLGLTRAHYVRDSYRSLFQDWRTRTGETCADMVFDLA